MLDLFRDPIRLPINFNFLFQMICVECNTLSYGVQRIAEISTKVGEKLIEITEFLRVKALQNYVLGSYPFKFEYFSLFFSFLDKLL